MQSDDPRVIEGQLLTTEPEPFVVLERSGDQFGHELLVRPSSVTAIEEIAGGTCLIRAAGRGYLVGGTHRAIADLLGLHVTGAVRPAPTPRFTPGDSDAVQPYRLGDPA